MTRTPAAISIRPRELRERVAPAWSPLAPAGVRDGAGGPGLMAAAALIAVSRAAAGSPRPGAGPLVAACAAAAVWPVPAEAASTAPYTGAAAADVAASIAAAQAAAISIQAVRRRRPTAPGRTITSMGTIAGEPNPPARGPPAHAVAGEIFVLLQEGRSHHRARPRDAGGVLLHAGGAVPAGQAMPRLALTWAQGAGGIVSSLRDMTIWDRALYRGRELPPRQQRQLESLVSGADWP